MAEPLKEQPFWRQQEVIFTSLLAAADARAVQRAAESGALYRMREGVYTPFAEPAWPGVVARNRNAILAALFEGAVVGWRNAFLGGAPDDGVIFLSFRYNRVVMLPGLKVALVKGAQALTGDLPWQGGRLHFSGEARALLENLAPTRGAPPRSAGVAATHAKLKHYLHQQGEAKLNLLRDQARNLALALGLTREADKLSALITTLLATHPAAKRAGAMAQPYDHDRLALFEKVAAHLRRDSLPSLAAVANVGNALTHFAFVESYFSNFIEGTKFALDEAIKIAIGGTMPASRPKDAHDIVGVMAAASHPQLRAAALPSGEASLNYLQRLHASIIGSRAEIRPGEWKRVNNAAGNTVFVHPDLVRGTLIAASQLLASVPEGLPRALLAMFVVAEVHPFDDGNGRLSRLVMNAELSRCGLTRIIVPTLMREDYLDCLRLLTRESEPAAFVRLMVSLQAWTAHLPFASLADLTTTLRATNALEENRSQFKLLTVLQ